MRYELDHFNIDGSYGGNQDWFPTFMMRIGGCGAETACDSCMYFAIHRGLHGIAPENAASLSREEYVDFAYEMKPYLSPRMSGIDRLDIYIDGFSQYLRDKGESRLTMTGLSGDEPWEAAKEAVIHQIRQGYPIPALVLNHRNKKLKDYVWHWFLINGFDDSDDGFKVKAVTYSNYEWLDLRELWDSGYKNRGGLVLYHLEGDWEN